MFDIYIFLVPCMAKREKISPVYPKYVIVFAAITAVFSVLEEKDV